MKDIKGGNWVVYILAACWLLTFVLSFLLPTYVEGPRNLDTGFRRLDILARWQLIAFSFAVVAGIAGILSRHHRPTLWIGLFPILMTLILAAGFAGLVWFNS